MSHKPLFRGRHVSAESIETELMSQLSGGEPVCERHTLLNHTFVLNMLEGYNVNRMDSAMNGLRQHPGLNLCKENSTLTAVFISSAECNSIL